LNGAGPVPARRRRGFTIAEVLVAFIIMGGAVFGLSVFMMRYAVITNDQSDRTLAYDLATARLEAVKGASLYRKIDSVFNNTSETWPTGDMYNGFTRRTWARRTLTGQQDFQTVTVQVSGRRLRQPIRITTVIARF